MTQRLNYIDALRGLAIFVVVYCHIGGFSMTLAQTSNISFFLTSFFIPLFFFISGYVAYKEGQEWNLYFTKSFLWKKIRTLYIPSVTLAAVSTQIYGTQLTWNVFRCTGMAWFTHTLFQMFVIYTMLSVIVSLFKKVNRSLGLAAFLCFLSIVFGGLFKAIKTENDLMTFLNMQALYRHFFFFAIGVILRIYQKPFHKLLDSGKSGNIIFTVIMIIAFADIYVDVYWAITNIARVLFLYILFYKFRDEIDAHQSTRNLWASPFNQLIYWGRFTLEIFYLNSFLLFSLPSCLSSYINWVAQTTCFCGPGSVSFAEFLIMAPITIITIYVAIALQWIIKKLPIIPQFLFGR